MNERRMKDAKSEREKDGENHHKEQCDTIPDSVNNELHGIHLETCYKKFTLILSGKKNVTLPKHLDQDNEAQVVWLTYIQISVKFERRRIVITTFDAQHTIK